MKQIGEHGSSAASQTKERKGTNPSQQFLIGLMRRPLAL